MFIHLRKEQFDLFLFQGGQLLVQTAFHKNADEFMYYLFYVCEQFEAEQFDLFFLGQYFPYSDYNGTKEFHPNCSY